MAHPVCGASYDGPAVPPALGQTTPGCIDDDSVAVGGPARSAGFERPRDATQRDALPVLCHAPVAHLGVCRSRRFTVSGNGCSTFSLTAPTTLQTLCGPPTSVDKTRDIAQQYVRPPRLHRHTLTAWTTAVAGSGSGSLLQLPGSLRADLHAYRRLQPRRWQQRSQRQCVTMRLRCAADRRQAAAPDNDSGVHPDAAPSIPKYGTCSPPFLRLMRFSRVPCAAPGFFVDDGASMMLASNDLLPVVRRQADGRATPGLAIDAGLEQTASRQYRAFPTDAREVHVIGGSRSGKRASRRTEDSRIGGKRLTDSTS